ncbi:methyl-accepting chemotaxis protein (plasmid) [Pararobbsia alpina]|uniref:methyl-accepting chemotaxis protein n=1 Tax=Pararobbsia alpina TaxID=621374 RepID=UPI0039A52B19
MGKMKVSSRLGIGFGLVLSLLCLFSALGFYAGSELNVRLSNIVQVNNAELNLANEMKFSVLNRALVIRNIPLLTDAAQVSRQISLVDQEAAIYRDAHEKLGRLFRETEATEREHTLFSQTERDEAAVLPVWANVISLVRANDMAAAIRVINDQGARPRQIWTTRLDELSEFESSLNDQAAAEAIAIYSRLRLATWIAVTLALSIGICAALLIARSVLRQLGGEPADAQDMARQIAQGDLLQGIKIKEGDTSSLMASLELMRQRLSVIVAGIKAASESIATAAGEIAQGNVDLSQRTEEQAASLEETAASMEQLTSTVRQNSENARQGNALALNASQSAASGGDVVQKVVSTMGDISASSTRVSEIISVIEGIAFQTNILALNAAVEAARAGEQGRGFAVVASEVCMLAQRSGTAAKEIKELIVRSVDHVNAGVSSVQEAGVTMSEVVRSIKRVTDIMGEVASASSEQSTGIDQVNIAVAQMDEVTQQNAALVEQASAAAQAMSEQARSLREAVAIFCVDEHLDGEHGASGSGTVVQVAATKTEFAGRVATKTALTNGSRKRASLKGQDAAWQSFQFRARMPFRSGHPRSRLIVTLRCAPNQCDPLEC